MMRYFRVAVQPGGPGSVLPWNATRLGLYFSGAVIKALPIWRIGWFPGERELYLGGETDIPVCHYYSERRNRQQCLYHSSKRG